MFYFRHAKIYLHEDSKYLLNFSFQFVIDLYVIACLFSNDESAYFEFPSLSEGFQSIVAFI